METANLPSNRTETPEEIAFVENKRSTYFRPPQSFPSQERKCRKNDQFKEFNIKTVLMEIIIMNF